MTILRSRQEVFNKVWEHAKGMKVPAYNGDMCQYRSPNGPCLIGALIKDEFYDEYLEGSTADEKAVIAVLHESGVKLRLQYPGAFLYKIQQCHDGIDFQTETYEVKNFNKDLLTSLRDFANSNNLQVPA